MASSRLRCYVGRALGAKVLCCVEIALTRAIAIRKFALSNYKLLATDLDGTLLASNGTVHPEDAEAIRALMQRGVQVTFCTGRLHSGCGYLARELGLELPLVCLDGSQIVDPRSGSPIATTALPLSTLGPLRQLLRATRPMAFVFSADRVFHDPRGDVAAPYVSIWSRELERVEDITDHPSLDEPALGLVTVAEKERIVELERAIHEELPELQTVPFVSSRPGFDGVWAMVIRSRGISKASGLEFLAAQTGIQLSEMIAVGDWLNDLSMLRAAGRSYAMGQAPAEVLEAADERLDATYRSGGGIAEAARRAGLL